MTLAATLEDHRALYRQDLLIERLVSRQPPTTFDYNRAEWDQEPAAAIGMNMSARLLKYVGHPDGMGSDFPWTRALYRLRHFCRRNHPYHRAADRPYWRGALCHQLVIFTVVRNWSLVNTARVLRYDNPEPVLSQALQFIEDEMDWQRKLAERRAREDAGVMLTCRCGHGWPRHDSPSRMFGCDACGCSRYNADAERPAA